MDEVSRISWTNELYHIYFIVNKINNKIYVGQTCQQPHNRWSDHQYELNKNNHRNIHLQRAWNLYGPLSFSFVTYDKTLTHAEANNIEEKLKILYCQRNLCYNIRDGGSNGRHAEETKRKMSIAAIGNKRFLNHQHSETTKAKMRLAHLGQKRPPLSEQHKAKIREEVLKRPQAWHDKLKVAQAKRGPRKPFSEEAKQKMRLAKLGKPGPWRNKKRPPWSEARHAAYKERRTNGPNKPI